MLHLSLLNFWKVRFSQSNPLCVCANEHQCKTIENPPKRNNICMCPFFFLIHLPLLVLILSGKISPVFCHFYSSLQLTAEVRVRLFQCFAVQYVPYNPTSFVWDWGLVILQSSQCVLMFHHADWIRNTQTWPWECSLLCSALTWNKR